VRSSVAYLRSLIHERAADRVLGASRIAEPAIICPAATLGHRIVAVAGP